MLDNGDSAGKFLKSLEEGAVSLRLPVRTRGLLAAAQGLQSELFRLPDRVKRKYVCPLGGGQRGFIPFGVERADRAYEADPKEVWHISREPAPGAADDFFIPAYWPAELPAFENIFRRLFDELDTLAAGLVGTVTQALGLQSRDFMLRHNSVLRLVHYRAPNPPGPQILAQEHFDMSLLTLQLFRSHGGCEFWRDGKWTVIDPEPGCILVTGGRMLAHLSNDRFPALKHRVRWNLGAHGRRDYLGYFIHPSPTAVLPCLAGENPPRYRDTPNLDLLIRRAEEINHV